MMKFSIKKMYWAITLCFLMVISFHTYAGLIFKFDNADIPKINFVGVESRGVHQYSGSDLLNLGDSFALFTGATSGSSELSSALNIGFNLGNLSGVGGALNLTPLTEQFYIPITKKSDSFNVSGVLAYFINNGEGVSFYSATQSPAETMEVSGSTSILLLLLALGFMWTAVICNTYHNA